MTRNIVKEYIDYDGESIVKFINVITQKKLNSKICDIIKNIYIDIRYFNHYEHVKNNIIDDICYYVKEQIKIEIDEKQIEKNNKLINDALLIIRYVILNEKYSNDNNISKLLINFEDKLKEEYQNSRIIINDLIKSIKSNLKIKERFINNLSSTDFSVMPKETNLKGVYNVYFENSVKIPDLFSQVAINRVYNNGIISEDKMLVFYLLTEKEILNDIVSFKYDKVYLLDFTKELLGRRNKLINLLKIFDMDYLKERMVLKIYYKDYLIYKERVDELIHDGISFGIILDSNYVDNMVSLDIFSYITVNGNLLDKSYIKKYKNVINLE